MFIIVHQMSLTEIIRAPIAVETEHVSPCFSLDTKLLRPDMAPCLKSARFSYLNSNYNLSSYVQSELSLEDLPPFKGTSASH